MTQFLVYGILALGIATGIMFLMLKRTIKKNKQLSAENDSLESEIDKLNEEAEKHLAYMATIEKFKEKHKDNRRLIEEAEDEEGVKGSFDNAIAELNELRKLREERRAGKN